MRGILLAGGKGTRLRPVTTVVSKQLLPIYDKPMIYYSLSTLMFAGVNEIALVTDPFSMEMYHLLLGDGSQFGISIEYIIQDEPRGITHGMLHAENFVGNEPFMLVLGDNVISGTAAGYGLKESFSKTGATIYTASVPDPENYGVLIARDDGTPVCIEEKPSHWVSNLAIAGLYVLDKRAFEFAKNSAPSSRGEFEITSVLNDYLNIGELKVCHFPRGTVWLDTGTVEGLQEAAEYVRVVQKRQNLLLSSPEEIGLRNGWISTIELQQRLKLLPTNAYTEKLKELLVKWEA